MKKIEALIKSFKLDEVRGALTGVGVVGLMVSEVQGCGRETGRTTTYRDQPSAVDLLPRVKLEVVVPDHRADQLVALIATAAKTGTRDAGKVFVMPVDDAIRIRTGEHGEAAL